MGLFPTNANDGDKVTNANGTTFEYVAADDKWIVVISDAVIISDLAYDATAWNANTDGASKNVLRDEIELIKNQQHSRFINTEYISPRDGWVAGNNNCYYAAGGQLTFGITGKTHYFKAYFYLPDDYVAGTDFILHVCWDIHGNPAGDTDVLDYKCNHIRYGDAAAEVAIEIIDATWTGADNSFQNFEELTLDGSTYSPNEAIHIIWYQEDDNNAFLSRLYVFSLEIQVNKRD